MASLADNLEPPYYAAIMETKQHESVDEPMSTSDRLVSLAIRRPGFLGLETARDIAGKPVTVSYWRDLADVEAWSTEGKGEDESDTQFPLEVRRVANAADNSARTLYVVPEDSRTTWRYT